MYFKRVNWINQEEMKLMENEKITEFKKNLEEDKLIKKRDEEIEEKNKTIENNNKLLIKKEKEIEMLNDDIKKENLELKENFREKKRNDDIKVEVKTNLFGNKGVKYGDVDLDSDNADSNDDNKNITYDKITRESSPLGYSSPVFDDSDSDDPSCSKFLSRNNNNSDDNSEDSLFLNHLSQTKKEKEQINFKSNFRKSKNSFFSLISLPLKPKSVIAKHTDNLDNDFDDDSDFDNDSDD
jgi:hypothetical protein